MYIYLMIVLEKTANAGVMLIDDIKNDPHGRGWYPDSKAPG